MKRIVICCDGTGNEYRAKGNTNVVKMYRLLDKKSPSEQVVYYDPGVGTMAARGTHSIFTRSLTQLMGLMFGYGISENVMNAYEFLMKTYETGDRIYLFGFSRGAYTARAIAGMLTMCGLLNKNNDNLIPYALRIYKQKRKKRPAWAKGWLSWLGILARPFWRREPDWHRAAGFKKYFCRECSPYFIGVWDTVKAVGWFRRRIVLPHTYMNPNLQHGLHAVSLDEKRTQYRPNLWGYENGNEFQQVWFAGVHSDVGGSYEDHGLADVALNWMIQGAKERGLKFIEEELPSVAAKPDGKIHNPLWPFWWMMGWWPRLVPADSLLHESVNKRMKETSYQTQAILPKEFTFTS